MINKNSVSEWLWRGLHFLLALSLPIVLSSLLSCIKAKEEPADLGPEVAPETIDLALSKAVHGANIDNTAVGQYVTYVINQRIENEEVTQTLGALKVRVDSQTVDPAYPDDNIFLLKIVQSTRLVDDTFETVEKEGRLRVRKPSAAVESFHPNLTGDERLSALAKPIKKTFHRLRETTALIDPPEIVRQRPGCGGLSSCKIPVKYVQYDMVEWYGDNDFRKLAFDLAFATATPYLPFGEGIDEFTGLLINNCVSTQVLITGRTVYVRQCVSLTDFQK